MIEKKHVITRRDFIRSGSCAVIGGLLGLPHVVRAAGQTTGKSRVVLIRNQHATEGYGSMNPGVVVQMLDEALEALKADKGFLLKGDVFTQDAIDMWIEYKTENEVNDVKLRPHPHEFFLYYDI